MLISNRLSGFAQYQRLPTFVFADDFGEGSDSSFYSMTFNLTTERPDRYVIVACVTGRNSNSVSFVEHTLDGDNTPDGVTQNGGKTQACIAYKHFPVGSTIDYSIQMSGAMGSCLAVCYEAYDLQPGPIINTRQGTGLLSVEAYGLVLAAGAADGGDSFSFSSMDALIGGAGSDFTMRIASKTGFTAAESFNIALSASPAQQAIVALSIR